MNKKQSRGYEERNAAMHATPTSSKLAEMLLTLKSTESITMLTPNDAKSTVLDSSSSRFMQVHQIQI
jgi:hypothetical protein